MDPSYCCLENMLNQYLHIQKKLSQKKIPMKYQRLDVNKCKNNVQFFHLVENPETGKMERKHIKKENRNRAKELAENQYLHKMNKLVNKRIKQLSALLREYQPDEIDRIYDQFHEAKKDLITPVTPTKTQLLSAWKEREFSRKEFATDSLRIFTNRGERVRSKTEKILADLFADLGIEYKYECPLQLDNVTIYPDFTFLDTTTNQEIYWEHNGMMDNPDYAVRAYQRIIFYEQNGIYRGDRLIVTYESSRDNLNYQWVRNLIERYKIPLNL